MKSDAGITDRSARNLLVYALVVLALACSTRAARAQDAAGGQEVFLLRCSTCHQIGEQAKNAVGPVLNGIVGRPAGTYPGYAYSDAIKGAGITWDEATLKGFLKNPRGTLRGTKMIFSGLPKDEDIVAVIAYVKRFAADGHQP